MEVRRQMSLKGYYVGSAMGAFVLPDPGPWDRRPLYECHVSL